jgi:hypothetical protein
MEELSRTFNRHIFFAPGGPEDRFQYFWNLVIAPGERVRYATCVLCSITVQGFVGSGCDFEWLSGDSGKHHVVIGPHFSSWGYVRN